MRGESLEFLKRLLTTPSPSGYESAAQGVWCEYARQYADEVRTDAYGNAVAVLNPGGDPKVMLDGHIDEIGLMVHHIDEKGFIYFQRIGGVDPALVRGKRVNIHTAKGIVHGVVAAPAIHLSPPGKEPKVPKMHESYIDIGAKDAKEARKRVAVGDPATFVDDFTMLDKEIAIARGFDNRAGAWTAIEALRIASESKGKLACAIYACSSVQEELGLIGAGMSAERVHPDAGIAIDVTHATDIPGVDVKEHGEVKMGQGPTVSIGRENHPSLVSRVRAVAGRKKIPLQTEAFSLTGGTDALAIFKVHGGVPAMILSIPNRYMHTTVEMLDLRDAQRAADLCAAVCLDLKKGERFAVKV
jgi:putative aminopeptidase FrvX